MTMLTREAIRKMTQEATFKKGLQIYYSKNRLTDFNVTEQRSTGKRTIRIRDIVECRVRDTGAENYRVRLEYDRNTESLISSTCQCLAFTNLNGMCRHCVAVLLKYADWRVKQGLYTRPEGNFERVDGGLLEGDGSAGANTAAGRESVLSGIAGTAGSAAGQAGAGSPAKSEDPGVPQVPAGFGMPSAQSGLQAMKEIHMLQQEIRAEAYAPKEETTPAMKALLGKQTRKRTAQVTEQMVHGRVRIEPMIHLSPAGDKVEFRIGADRMYVMKDITAFVNHMNQGEEFSYGKNLTFTHTMESIAPESRAMARFILSHAPAFTGTPVRHLMIREREFEELMNLCEESGVTISMDSYFGQSGTESLWQFAEGWRRHLLTLTGEKEGIAETRVLGLRGSTDAMMVRLGRECVYLFDDNWIYRMPRRDVEAISDWLKTLPPKPERWDEARFREFLKTNTWKSAEQQRREFFIERTDIPAFCRELLPPMKKFFNVEQEEFQEEDFEMARAAFHFYLDTPEKDVVTCRALASYGEREYALYRGMGAAGREAGFADRDLVAELSVWQALEQWLPLESLTAGVSERMLAGDEDALYRLLTDGVTALQNLGVVYVSDALRRVSVRPAPAVNLGVSLSGDLLNLTVDAEGLTREELAEILSHYDRRKKFTRLKNGDFIQMDSDEIQALADMQEGMGFTAKDLKNGEPLELPRYRAMFLDKQMREGALDGIPIERSRDFKALVRNMRTVEDSDYEVPESLNGIMRSYQKQGFRWLKTLKASGFGGILADDMGLGKTLQVISFLLSEHEERIAAAEAAASADSGASGESAVQTVKKPLPTLIVCPASLVYNWEAEIRKFAPTLDARVIAGNAAERKDLLDEIQAATDSAEGSDAICVTSYELLRRDIDNYENMKFGVQVIDEAQYIKNHDTKAAKAVKQIHSGFKVALTGTPIENRLSELWSIFDYMMPGFLYGYEQFRKRLEKPIVANGSEQAMARLQRMIAPFILRRLKKDVLRDLPDKIEENMIARMEEEQRAVYDAQVQVLRDMLEGQTDEEFSQEQMVILSMLTRLRQLCCDPSLVFGNYEGGAAKVDLCMELIGNAMDGGHKMLVFSQFTSMLGVLEKRLEEAGIAYYKLEGATPKKQRMEMVEAFNREDDQTPVFLISLKAGGTGLNLTAADVVIHFDPWWNQAAQNQATDRAHRIGQKQVVNVYKLIAQDTIEENIMRLQEKKADLADKVLGGQQLSSGSFSREELLEILG